MPPAWDLLPIETTFAGDKATHQASAKIKDGPGWFAALEGQTVSGYEIHMGRTQGLSPFLEITERNGQSVQAPDGAASADGKVWGCYIHGLFANENLRRAWLAGFGLERESKQERAKIPSLLHLTRLADTLEATLNMELLEKIVWEN